MQFTNILFKKVSADISPLDDERGALIGFNLKFREINNEFIYKRSDGTIVNHFPAELTTKGINIDLSSFVDLYSLLLSTTSSYLFKFREEISKDSNFFYNIEPRFPDENRYIRASVSKYFVRKEHRGRIKISMSIFVKDEELGDYEQIMFEFSKTDAQWLIQAVNSLVFAYDRVKSVFVNAERIKLTDETVLDTANVAINKTENSIVIDNIWLHNQEILTILYSANMLVSKQNIEDDLSQVQTNYRQVMVKHKNRVAYLILKKLNEKSEDNSPELIVDESGKKEKYRVQIQLSARALAAIYMFSSIELVKITPRNFDEVHEESSKQKDKLLNNPNVKYCIGTKESVLGIAVKKKYGTKKNPNPTYTMSLVGKVKDGAYSLDVDGEEDYKIPNVVVTKRGTTDVLTEFDIPLGDEWIKFIKALSLALTKEYISEDKTFSYIKSNINKTDMSGCYKYYITVLSNIENEAAAVLRIDKCKYNKEKGIEELVSSYRQPLYEKYVHSLLTAVLATSRFLPEFSFQEVVMSKVLIPFKYSSLKKVTRVKSKEKVEYGMRRDNEKTEWGILSGKGQLFSELSRQDQFYLRISALNRLYTKKWLPFVGFNIAIGPDGHLTDNYGEINLEERSYDSGLLWAKRIFFGTSID